MGINIKENDRILIVAPHPDDESIGCGGLLAAYGKQCDVLAVTDGDNRKIASDIADVREREFVQAVSLAGVHAYQCLRIPEGKIRTNRKRIAETDFKQYDHVFVPNRYDEHRDHRDVYRVVRKMIGKKTRLYEYEVWTPLRKTNICVDISDVSERKIEMIRTHESQVRELDYVGMIMGLNAYRGRSRGFSFAECYYCAKEYKAQQIRRFKRKLRGLR